MLGFSILRKALFSLVLYLVLSVAAFADPLTFSLKNGVKVVILPLPTDKVVVLSRTNVGFLDEKTEEGETGVTHLIEHMFFRGTKKKRSAAELKKAYKKLLVDFNASTTYTRTNFFLVGPAENTEKIVQLLGEQITQPLFAAADIKSEMNPVIEEALRDLANPHFSLYENSIMVHAENDRMTHLMTGTPVEIKGYTPEMVRKIYETYYTGPNTVVVVAGGVHNIGATLEAVEKGFGSLPDRAAPAPGLAKEELRPHPQGKIELVKVKAPGLNQRKLNINFPLRRTPELEAAGELLSKYLNRRGAGSTLQPLIDLGLVSPSGGISIGVDAVRDLMFFRVAIDLTAQGEQNSALVMTLLNKTFAEIAKNGLPEGLVDDMRMSYALNDLGDAGLLDTAERISDVVAELGPKNIDKPEEILEKVENKQIQELAAKLVEPRAEPTLFSSSFEGKPNATVDKTDISKELADADSQLSKLEIKLDAKLNPVLHLNQATLYGNAANNGATRILIAPRTENTHVEAAIELAFMNSMSSRERVAADLAIIAFQLDPVNVRQLSLINEAGVDLNFNLNSSDMKLTITAEGTSKETAKSLELLLSGIRGYEPDAQGIARAKEFLRGRLLEVPSGEVSSQSLALGVNMIINNGKARDLNAQIRAVDRMSVTSIKKVLSIMRDRWGTKATLTGNWDEANAETVKQLLTAPHPEKPEAAPAKKRASKAELPDLVVRKADVDRQGVSRLFSIEAKPYSKEYWAIAIFSEILDARLGDVVRQAEGLAYAVQSGADELPGGRTLLYIYGDTSKRAEEMAMAYTVALDEALSKEPTQAEFKAALYKVSQQLDRMSQGAAGLGRRVLDQVDFEQLEKNLAQVKRKQLLETVKPLIAKAKKIDAVAAGANDPICEKLLSDPGAISAVTQYFMQNLAPKLRMAY